MPPAVAFAAFEAQLPGRPAAAIFRDKEAWRPIFFPLPRLPDFANWTGGGRHIPLIID